MGLAVRSAIDSGSVNEVSHVCAKHLNAEFDAHYNISKAKVFDEYKQAFDLHQACQDVVPKRYRDGYRAYIGEQVKDLIFAIHILFLFCLHRRQDGNQWCITVRRYCCRFRRGSM